MRVNKGILNTATELEDNRIFQDLVKESKDTTSAAIFEIRDKLYAKTNIQLSSFWDPFIIAKIQNNNIRLDKLVAGGANIVTFPSAFEEAPHYAIEIFPETAEADIERARKIIQKRIKKPFQTDYTKGDYEDIKKRIVRLKDEGVKAEKIVSILEAEGFYVTYENVNVIYSRSKKK